MIYTITFSPSIDYVIKSNKEFNSYGLNRINDFDIFCGGKGINASVVLKRIGFDSRVITFTGGKTKNFFYDLLKQENLEVINFEVEDNTRINVKYFGDNNSFEINGPRTNISENRINELLAFISCFNKDDIVFIMGVCKQDHLIKLVDALNKNNVEFVLDVDLENNLEVLKYKPFIIKPNVDELQRMLNITINSENDILNSMKKLISLGCKNVMVSNGKDGSYLLTKNNTFYKVKIDEIQGIKSTVGAGDTLISSFVCLYKNTNNVYDSLLKATSLSIGTSCSMWLAKNEDIDKFKNKIKIYKNI
ncbi:1-phosphofructokinase [Malacoplasma iowae]|uniref:1-phosphofructokinase family hexose kinase n=1 Tax=Malacoplasma iowae 695 TaxID=1048830 RepID=A0A6P1LBC7_MALIO|nr:1-phosphofructokinase family hexose kinase [Malacoplasma iowae]VEU63054.1 1-phosphofructokinase [Mycoplasmopsis fermentans]EGZ30917.1 1-phosphofructokinase [Malacoplasma iowae 695]QHG89507.1 1-phosphofructokinase family hexose kinase [Malacoplasma iowae 695]WPL35717.1 1-phosphofructokinase family hexose kinase [Malacoplasma iowae]WPL35782.1 1-phosphofructokinase family hexose kinase [Malacoplasma iowae]